MSSWTASAHVQKCSLVSRGQSDRNGKEEEEEFIRTNQKYIITSFSTHY
jgi:hypothetical protein